MQPNPQGYNVTTETVSYPGNGGSADGFLARPNDGQQHLGVILVQEWWGLEPHIKDLAQQIANEGYVVLTPDFYHGKVVAEPNEAQKGAMTLNKDEAVAEIEQAIVYLRGRDDVEPKAVGMAGFCMGGMLTLRTAEQVSEQLACIAPFYPGGYNPTAEDMAKITVPILAIFGENDPSIPKSTRDNIANLIEQQEKDDSKVIVYPDAGHAFMNPTHGMGKPDAAADAFTELIAFFKQHLG
ncbi:MAG: hypothetical protein DLM69_03845 [Candidatus Chloroheliales bacterium]|nr:MAG: hypothetical protein DLM69_03845 [Chloroflexota bacterium]